MIAKKDFLSIGETAKKLHVSIVTLRRWDASGKLTSIRTNGGFRRYNITDVEILKQGKYNAPSTPELTLDQAAQKLGVSSQTIRRWEKKGKIKLLKNQNNKKVIPLSSLKKALHFPLFPASKFSRPLISKLAIFTSAAALIYLLLSPKTAPAFLYQKVYAPAINKIAALISPYSPDLALTLENFIQGVLKEKNPRIIYTKGGVVAGENTLVTKNLAQFILPQTPNLLADSSFEASNLGSVNTVWTYIGDASSQNTIVSPASERTGTKSLKIENAAFGSNPGISQPSTQTINGRTYLLSAWVRLQNVDNPPALRLGLFGTAKTSDPNYYGMSQAQWEKYSADRFSDLPLNDKHCQNDWCQIKAYFANVPLGKYPILQLINYQGGTIFIDDTSFSEASPEGNKTGPLYPGGNNPAGSFTTTQNNMTIGDGSILIDSFGNITPNTPFYGGSLGTFNRTFDSLYLKNASITSAGDATIGHDLTVKGALTVNGNSTLGFDSGSSLSIKASIASDLIPASTDTYNLGTTSYEWNDIYAKNLHLSASDFTQGNLTLSGTTGATFEGIGAGITFTGSGNHLISASAGILQIGAATYTGNLTLSDNINILPSSTTPSNDIGSVANLFRNIYAQNIYGTVTPSGFTQGSVIFAGAGGALSQNNSQFFWNNSSYSLGIGTTNPSAKLDIAGTLRSTLRAAPTTGAGMEMDYNAGIGYLYPYDRDGLVYKPLSMIGETFRLRVGTAGTTEGISVTSAGQVGIGTTTPGSKLHLYNSASGATPYNASALTIETNGQSYLQFLGPNTTSQFILFGDPESNIVGQINYNHSTNKMAFVVLSTQIVTMAYNSVGIGTTGPASMLSVGPANQFQVNSTGNIVKLNSLTTSFPSLQGATGSILTNSDGLGTLTWGSPSGTGILGYWQRNGTSLAPSNIGDYVGIGTTSPNGVLDVFQGTTASRFSRNTSQYIGITTDTTGNTLTSYSTVGGPKYLYLNTDVNSSGIAFQVNSVTKMVIDQATGNVGIGTVSPASLLDVNGTAWLRGTAGSTTGGLYVNSVGNVGIGTTNPGTANLAIMGGNVGIGTTSPVVRLDLYGVSSGPAATSGSTATTVDLRINRGDGGSNVLDFGLDGANPASGWIQARLKTNFATNFNLLLNPNGGNVGIGTTLPTSMFSVGSLSQFQVNSTGNIVKLNSLTTSFPSLQGATGSILTNSDGLGTLTWGSPSGTGILGYWQRNGTSLAPSNIGDYVGIGTTSPYAPLTIRSTNAGAYAEGINLDVNDTNTNSAIGIDFNLSTSDLTTVPSARIQGIRGTGGSGDITFSTRSVGNVLGEWLRITSSGNVGIGTATPEQKLTINGDVHIYNTATLGSNLVDAWTNNVTYPYETLTAGSPASDIAQAVNTVGLGAGDAYKAFTIKVGRRYRASFTFTLNSGSYPRFLSATSASGASIQKDVTVSAGVNTIEWTSTRSGTEYALFYISAAATDFSVSGFTLQEVTGGNLNLAGILTGGGTTGLSVDYLGNVGIGDIAPGTKLSVVGNAQIGYASGTTGPANGLVISGNVGIGTTNPGETLEVNGNIKIGLNSIYGNSTNNYLSFANSNTNLFSAGSIALRFDSDNNQTDKLFTISNNTGTTLFQIDESGSVWAGGTAATTAPVMAIQSGGNVGIGTTSPSYKLDVSGGTGIVGQFSGRVIGGDAVNSNEFTTLAQLSGGTGSLWLDGGDYLYPNSSFATNARIPSGGLSVGYNSAPPSLGAIISGNVGIGTTNPIRALDVVGAIAATTTVTSPTFYVSGGYISSSMDSNYGKITFPITGTKGTLISTNEAANVALTVKNTFAGYTGDLQQWQNNSGTSLVVINSSGNVGIGTTAPGYKLDIQDSTAPTLRLYNTTATTVNNTDLGNVLFYGKRDDGTAYNAARIRASAPSFSSRVGKVYFETGFADVLSPVMTLTAISGGGYVGIGTTTPLALLHVNAGIIEITNGSPASYAGRANAIELGRADVALGYYSQLISYSGSSAAAANTINFELSDGTTTGHSTIMSLQGSGNVGIGTTGPAGKLHVFSSSASQTANVNADDLVLETSGTTGLSILSGATSQGNIYFADSGNAATGRITYDNANDSMALYTLGTERLRITSGGLVGIGTTAPNGKLDVNRGTDASNVQLVIDANGSNTYNNILYFRNTGTAIGKITYSTDLSFVSAAAVQGLYQQNGGNVGIGTTNPLAMLSVGSNSFFRVSSTGDLTRINNVAYSWPSSQASLAGSVLSNDASGNLTWASPSGTGTVGYWQRNGTYLSPSNITDYIGIGTTAPSAFLDVMATTTQLRLSYSSAYFTNFTIDATGMLTLAPNGTTAATFSDVGNTFDLPTSFNAAGDTSMAYDLIMTNQTASNISSYGPLTIDVGENWESNDLTLRTYNSGSLVLDIGSGNLWSDGSNVGIGTTNPAAGFDVQKTAWLRGSTLGNGGLYVDATGNIGIGTTSPSARLSLWGAGTGTGINLRLRDSTGADKVAFLDNGNVGIGTTSPTSMFSVGSLSQFQVNSTGNIVKLNSLTTSFPSLQGATGSILTNSDGLGTLTWGSPSGTGILGYWQRNGTSLAPSNIGDYVGIGTTTPNNLLAISGSSAKTIEIKNTTNVVNGTVLGILAFTGGSPSYTDAVTSANPGAVIKAIGSGTWDTHLPTALTFSTTSAVSANYAERMRIDASGNVGIGTTAPGAMLEVNGGVNVEAGLLHIHNGTGTTATGLQFYTDTYLYRDSLAHLRTPNTFIVDGNVGIGTTAPNGKLDVNRGTDASNVQLVIDANGSNTYNNILYFRNTGNAIGKITYSTDLSFLSAAAVQGLYQQNLGNVGIGTTAPGAKLEVNGQVKVDDLTAAGGGSTVLSSAGILTTVASSGRYKENITDYGPSLDIIKKLRPVDFTWKGNTLTPGMKDFGLIAEEVAQISPELVTYELDNTTIRGVKYDKLPILLIKAMQEQQGQIDLTKTTADTALKTANSVKETVTAQTNLIAALQGQVDLLKSAVPVNPTLTPTPTPTPSLTPSPSPTPTPPTSPNSPNLGIGVSSPTDLGIGASGPFTASGFWLPSPESTPSAIQTNYDVNIFQDLHVLGKFIAQDVGLTGTLRNGVLVIDGLEGSVQTLSGSLKLQKDALGPIEIMGSLIEIDTEGNIISKSEITAEKFNIDTANVLSSSAGRIDIPAGQTSLTIETTAVTEKSLIFATPVTLPVPLSASFLSAGKFIIKLSSPQSQIIKVNWWIVN